MAKIRIRPARPQDALQLKTVVASAYGEWIRRLDDLPDVTAGLAEDIATNAVWLAVNSSDFVLGGIVLVLGDEAHVANLAVAPDAAGQGIGQALLRQAEMAARDAGHCELHLATHKDMAPTLRFYQRAGWTITRQDGTRCYLAKSLA